MSALEWIMEVFVAVGVICLAMGESLGRQYNIKGLWLYNAYCTHNKL